MPIPPSKPKRKRRILRSLVVDEVSGVDRAAQVPAQALLRKRAPAEKGHPKGQPVLTSAVNGHQHMLDLNATYGETSDAVSEGSEIEHEHYWVKNLDGSVTIGAADGHTHEVTSPTVGEASKSAGGAGGGHINGDDPMTKQESDAAKGTEIPEAVQKSIADLTARAERAEAIMKLNADERAMFDGLQGDAQTGFLTKSASDRAELIREAREADQVVYKSANGEVYRASDDPRLVKMAREADEERERTRKALEKAENARLEKRADDELGHCPGTVEQRASILKALEGVEGATEFLKAADAALAKSFKPSGTSGTSEELAKAEDRLDALTKAYAEAHPGVTYEAAQTAVLATPEGGKLYAEIG